MQIGEVNRKMCVFRSGNAWYLPSRSFRYFVLVLWCLMLHTVHSMAQPPANDRLTEGNEHQPDGIGMAKPYQLETRETIPVRKQHFGEYKFS